MLLTFNHPLRVAEKAATLDLHSGGRFEIGTARSNNPRTLKASKDSRTVYRISYRVE